MKYFNFYVYNMNYKSINAWGEKQEVFMEDLAEGGGQICPNKRVYQ